MCCTCDPANLPPLHHSNFLWGLFSVFDVNPFRKLLVNCRLLWSTIIHVTEKEESPGTTLFLWCTFKTVLWVNRGKWYSAKGMCWFLHGIHDSLHWSWLDVVYHIHMNVYEIIYYYHSKDGMYAGSKTFGGLLPPIEIHETSKWFEEWCQKEPHKPQCSLACAWIGASVWGNHGQIWNSLRVDKLSPRYHSWKRASQAWALHFSLLSNQSARREQSGQIKKLTSGCRLPRCAMS